MSYAFGSNTQTQIEMFIMSQTGTYQEQTIRPFRTQVADATINQLVEATYGGQRLGVAAIDGIASQVIQPSASTEGTVGIPEGWNSRRFRFIMRVIETQPFIPDEKTIRIFFGYTDQCDVSYGNNIDPQMRIYFNSETTIRDKISAGINGPVRQAIVTGSNQIITPAKINTAGREGSPNYSFLIRPEDVFSIKETELSTAMAAQNIPGGIDQSYNYNAIAGVGQFQLSRRRDTSPTRYIADTLGAMQHAVSESEMLNLGNDYGGGLSNVHVYGEAAARAANTQIGSDVFLAKLRDHLGYMEKGYVTFQELAGLFPEVTDFGRTTHVGMDDGRSIRKVSQVEDSSHWAGADNTTIAASLLAQVVPAIMMDNFIRSIGFAITNSMMPGQYSFIPHPQQTASIVSELNMIPYLQEFERRLNVDAINSITRYGQIPFSISMSSDLAGDSVIDISLDGEPIQRYVAPTFTDSLFSPMVSTDQQAVNKVSNDMIFLTSQILPSSADNINFAVPMPQPTTLAPNTTPSYGVDSYAENFGLL